MEFIRKHLELSAELSDEDWSFFSSRLKRQQFSKKKTLLKSGETEHYLSFVETGIIRFFIAKEEKNDLTFSFAFNNSFMSAYESFLTRSPSAYQVETLTDTVLWRLNYQDLQDIYAHTKVGNNIGRLAAEALYLSASRRQLSLLNKTAEQRYYDLFSNQPHLIKLIPLKYIAAYIGISPQALSRIRKRIK